MAEKKTLAEVRAEISWGEMFHTALRKGADSKWSALLWQMINCLGVLDEEARKKDRVWPFFVRWCEKRYRETEEKPSEIVKAFVSAHDDYTQPDHAEWPRSNAMTMFTVALELCFADTESTYEQIDGWIGYTEEEYRGG